MKSFFIRYKVKPDKVVENENLIKQVFAELKEAVPASISYSSYKLDDGVSFMHVVTQVGDESPVTTLPAFAEFTKNIGERCDEPPKTTNMEIVGSYSKLVD